ncbi:MAG: molybdenum cofactor biosynthesis protein, partial [Syntrophorhabdus sp.]|nr:molybdenum cofactor biosynthesis protein [Syntrophorhabdus sp.]
MSYRVQVITVSDKGSRGERVDTSGPAIRNILEKDFTVGDIIIVPDE